MAKKNILLDCPIILRDFLLYLEHTRGRSKKTVYEYYLDIKTFFRFIKIERNLTQDEFSDIDIKDIDIELIKTITLSDLYTYLHFLSNERENDNPARSRKISSLKTFFDYLINKVHLITVDPTQHLDSLKSKRALPKFLTLEQSIELLVNINSTNKERDYCMITFLINCGMRLSELVGININDIQDNNMRILGKGNKERFVYLNDACVNALEEYLSVRGRNAKEIKDNNALFLNKNGSRLTGRRVEQILEDALKNANLDNMGYSPHKLRHTAATLMYQHGNVDIRTLQEILGHSNLGTTEIYTHVASKQIEDAVKSSPLANIKRKKDKE